MTPRLVAISGPLEGQSFLLQGDLFVIGRHAECDLRVTAIEVSRRHCEIIREPGDRFRLRDLGSRHGTQVNGRPADDSVLSHSDLVTIGTHAWLFLLDTSSTGEEATGSLPTLSSRSLEKRITQSLHLDPARVEEALPAQARLARELHVLLRLSTTLQEERNLYTLGARPLDATLEALPTARRGAVFLREPGLSDPIRLAERGDELKLPEGLLSRVLEEGVSTLEPLTAGGGRLAAPLSDADGHSIGLMVLESPESSFEEHHLELLGAIAGVASLACRNALHLRWLERENQRLREEQHASHDMIGESAAMRRVIDLIARVARADSTVLIQGESGTGKELAAHAIHRSSPRRDGPFIAVNCATLSENLLESELFGHEKGAFTGAARRKIGKMEAAHQGTLFLDEVAEIPVGLQAKLLRALQEREIERVGGTRPIAINVRIVAATHRRLEEAVADGDFRQDLFYRLKVITCELPALRQRRDDVPLLAAHFTRRHGEKMGTPDLAIAPEARRCLLAYDWPGNVRELANVIERAVVLGDGELIRREDLPDEVAGAKSDSTNGETGRVEAADSEATLGYQDALVAFKKQLILDAWHVCGEDYARTAKRLEVHVNSLHRMVKTLGLKASLGR